MIIFLSFSEGNKCTAMYTAVKKKKKNNIFCKLLLFVCTVYAVLVG